ncbi:DUF2946 family protein [Azospirillum canadense]|uniref:DUF2946 family protein n=1 Tax=Azospirillum canadense TaxID=403962 RepID=UPI00222778DF|nr:DUF2946 family protein [Azospirillum canadense]MCW2237963.1 hypothetical protein [Azospirillum canadense]
MAVCLAVLAILVQTIVPDFAMAARQQAPVVAAQHVQHALHHHPDGAAWPAKSAPADRHPHEELCAFCLALNTHGTPTHPGAELAVPVSYAAAVVLAQPGIRPPQLFFVGSGPRAPPAAEQV